MINHLLLEFPLIDLPLILASSSKGAVVGLVELGMPREDAQEYISEVSPEHASGWAILVTDVSGGVICALMVAKKSDRNTVAHEATHIAVKALDWAGIEYDVDNHEILAMSVGWLVERHSESWVL